MIKLKDILDEMAKTDIHYQNVMNQFNKGDEQVRDFIYKNATGRPYTLEKALSEMGIEDIIELEDKIEEFVGEVDQDYNPLEEKKKKSKINPAYLTKDAAAMKKEINRVKKLKSDDPSAYGKWEADYADKAKTKKYKTKKSAATSAYEKRFGKKEK